MAITLFLVIHIAAALLPTMCLETAIGIQAINVISESEMQTLKKITTEICKYNKNVGTRYVISNLYAIFQIPNIKAEMSVLNSSVYLER